MGNSETVVACSHKMLANSNSCENGIDTSTGVLLSDSTNQIYKRDANTCVWTGEACIDIKHEYNCSKFKTEEYCTKGIRDETCEWASGTCYDKSR